MSEESWSEKQRRVAEASKAVNALTLRDYFAVHVSSLELNLNDDVSYETEARERYKFADAMLKVRNES